MKHKDFTGLDQSNATHYSTPMSIRLKLLFWWQLFVIWCFAPVRASVARRLCRTSARADIANKGPLSTNLSLCFPHLDATQRRSLAINNMYEYFYALFDRFRYWRMSEAAIRRNVSLNGLDELKAAMRAGPVVLICPHFLGVEVGLQRLSLEGRFICIYQASTWPAYDGYRNARRSRFNKQILFERADSFRKVVRELKRGYPLVLLADLDAGENGVFVPFFGVSASTVRTPAWCVEKLQASVLPFIVLRTGEDAYQATIYPALSGLGVGVEEDTRAVNQVIEAFVRKNPDQYWWDHQRFATRPPGCKPVYQTV